MILKKRKKMFKCLFTPILYFILSMLFYLTIGFILLKNIGLQYIYIIALVEGFFVILSFIQARGIYRENIFKEGMRELFKEE